MEIRFDKVGFSYQKVNYEKKEILKDVSVTFQKNKINGLIGKNGNGKTTIANLISGLIMPTSGKIYIDDMELTKKNAEKLKFNIGLVFQNPDEQFLNKTVKEELEFNLKLYNYRVNEMEKRIKDALIMLGLSQDYLDLNLSDLSNGEKKKIAIASVLLFNPKVLILDDPTIGLDKKSRKNFIKIIRLLKNRYKKTIIIISNDVDFILGIVDNIYILNEKNIVINGKKIDIFKQTNILKKNKIAIPKIIKFEDLVLKRNKIKIGYRDDINDLIKDIYRNVR